VEFHPGLANTILVEDELFLLRAEGRVVWFQVLTRPNTTPARGAEAARKGGGYLLEHVLRRRSSWRGAVLDVREGPSVFGPVTLRVCEEMFRNAEEARKPLCALVGRAPSQRAQYESLVAEFAPRFGKVVDTVVGARDWMTEAG
jgi:hypothetical protein